MIRARVRLAEHFKPTPLLRAASLSTPFRDVWIKNETVLPTGSFKVRGALHALGVNLERHPVGEVVAASTGNHGAAVAFAAQTLGVRARIFVPEGSNPVKLGRIRDYGAALIETGPDLSAAIDAAGAYARERGALFLHDASDPDIPAGTATIGAEIVEALPSIDALFVPMGDTALIRGVASAVRAVSPQTRVVGVVAQNAPAYYLSWNAGHVIETDSASTIADGLAVRRPLPANVAAIRVLVADVARVTEAEMLQAIVAIRQATGILAEPSGAAAVAALLKDPLARGTCAALVTGGNISPAVRSGLPDL